MGAFRERHTAAQGCFALQEGEAEAGFLTYVRRDGVMVIEHTVVSEDFRGRGIAGRLVERAAAYAREQSLGVEPQCSYARRFLEREERFRDLLAGP